MLVLRNAEADLQFSHITFPVAMSDSLRNKSLLLIDDDANLQGMLQDYLEFCGFQVTTADHGQAGLDRLKDNPLPDLIICDVMMPQMDGYTFVRKLRANTQTQWIPVLLLSAKGQLTDRIQGLGIGADYYLTKPFEPEELVAQIEACFCQTERLRQHHQAPFTQEPSQRGSIKLTPAETKILHFLCRGSSNGEIAELLGISQRTVETHVSRILGKTQLKNRTELARWAIGEMPGILRQE